MNFRTGLGLAFMAAIAGLGVLGNGAGIGTVNGTRAQRADSTGGPDPREIPVPAIKTKMKPLPSVAKLPLRKGVMLQRFVDSHFGLPVSPPDFAMSMTC